MRLADRLSRLEQNHAALSDADFEAGMRALEERFLARLRGEEAVPPRPPPRFFAELERRDTPNDIEEATAKLLRILERKSASAQVV